ncbi:MAG: hypothetical protein Q4C13_02070 [Clostridia bacterium]|nr:hypothetical protein [Clostridia bacterium]
MMKLDFVDSIELGGQQALDLLGLGMALKSCVRAEYYPALLKKKCVGYMLSGDELLELSLKTAVHQLGGYAEAFDLPLEPPSAIRSLAMELSRLTDCLVISCPRHESLLALAKYATVPVINAGSGHSEPIQELADLITMFEHLPQEKKLEECKAVYDGPASPKCTSALFICTKVGMQFVQLCGEKSGELKPPVLKIAERNVKKSGGTYTILDNPAEAYHGANFVFMDAPMGTKLPPEAEGVLRIDPNENRLSALRTILVRMLYSNPALREPILIEKLRRMLAVKLQNIFGFGEAAE